MAVTMGNFFSGSGTWELAAKICGMKVLWESEIEPFPVELEEKRFPEAKQLGNIMDVNGREIEPVDVMTNSSPCQDLSVAGKRAGLDGDRSSLFMEVIRITKEMREANGNEYPKLWLWENVPGALSSGTPKGEDFRRVIEEIAHIVDPEVSIPLPKKWEKSGSVDGDGWSIAWCVRNAASEGVPQRRRRIFLVADFTGECAGEILFKSESLHWHFAEIAETWKDTSRSLEERIDAAGRIVGRGLSEPSVGRILEKNF